MNNTDQFFNHIKSTCKSIGEYNGIKHKIISCIKPTPYKKLLNKLLKRNIFTYKILGKDWKVLDKQGIAYVGPLDECIEYFIRYEIIKEDNN